MNNYETKGPQGEYTVYYHSSSLLADKLFFTVDNIGKYKCNKHYWIDRSRYYSYLILVTTSGEGIVEYGDKDYILDPDHILFINTQNHHRYYTSPECGHWDFSWIHFDGILAEQYLQTIFSLAGPVFKIEKPERYAEKIDAIIDYKQHNYPHFEPRASSVITNILNNMLIHAGRDINEKAKTSLEITKALDYIKTHYYENVSIVDIAAFVHLSQSHFTRLFKATLGYSPYEYLIKYRITVSKYLLCNTQKCIFEIAQEVGFASTNNFISTFKKYEGTTPNAYRNGSPKYSVKEMLQK